MNTSEYEDSNDDPRLLQAAREYLAALESGRKPDRQTYIRRNPELAAELSECLAGVELAFAAGEALRPRETLLPEPPPTEPLGDFQIIREIGRGGMGIVYEAKQLSLSRRVALKVLPFAAGLDAKQLQRFRTESHAAAQLHHTNIVPVYAVGCERGTHFYAMQLIDGKSLAELIDELGMSPANAISFPPKRSDSTLGMPGELTANTDRTRQPSQPTARTQRDKTSYRTAANIAMQVAEALHYAHEAGVIHRDIKPANLMLDGKGNVWVTDFGLAQVSNEQGLTRTGDIFGTLRYMSPEQASGRRIDVDQRTDVYSLGATLYELLTLKPIFDIEDRRKLLSQILNDDPSSLRSHDRNIPIELETIVLKATAKLPHERYTTAGELAADLRRFLDDRPILARRATLWDRSRKWMRRHPSFVGASFVLLLLGLLGFAGTTLVVAREKYRTQQALISEQQRAVEAEQRLQLARRSVDDMIQIAEDELSNDPSSQAFRRRLLEAALAYYQEFIALKQNDPKAAAELEVTQAKVRSMMADIAVMQGAFRHVLLGEVAVQDDLKLNDNQRAAVRDLYARIGFKQAPRTGREKTKQSVLEEIREHEAAVVEILTDAQDARLKQIVIQIRGLFALRDPEIVASLKLTATQKDKLRTLLLSPNGGPFGGGRGPKRDGKDDGNLDRFLEELTPAQRQTWQTLIGAPYRGQRPFFNYRGPGDGPPKFPKE